MSLLVNKRESLVLESLSKWFGKSQAEIRGHVSDTELHYLSLAMELGHIPPLHRLIRKSIGLPLAKLPGRSRRRVTSMLKRFRNPKRVVPIHNIASFPSTQLMYRLTQKIGIPKWRNGATWALCVSHDVDDIEGWEVVSEIAEIDAKAGLQTTFNFLTGADYDLTPYTLHKIESYGHEIGLHGWTHDVGLSYRSPKFIQKTLKQAKARLPEAKGFRAPALSVSQQLFHSLEQTGFEYDSTLQVGCTFYKSVELCLPYRLPGLDLWELPLLVQDDIFLRDATVNEESIMPTLANLLDVVESYGGFAVINLHPHLMASRLSFYRRLVNWLSNRPNAVSLTMGEALQQVINRSL